MNPVAQIVNHISFIFPETGTVLAIVLLIIQGLFFAKDKKLVEIMFFASMVAITALNIYQTWLLEASPKTALLASHILISSKASYIKSLLSLVAILFFVYKKVKKDNTAPFELYLTVLAQLLGAFIVVQAGSYVTLFLGIEIVSITSYILAYFGTDAKAKISAMKYFLFGAFSSALMIYGISWMYGITGDYLITDTPKPITSHFDIAFYYLAVLCLYAGLFFKISAIPFHLWTPDVYKYLPNSILIILSLLPKIAGIVALYHIHQHLTFLHDFGTISEKYLFVVSIITMLMGNLVTLKQSHFKSFFAFSSIAQTGLLLAFIPSFNIDILFFYLSFYVFMNVGLLSIYESFVANDQDTELQQLSGLGLKSPILGISLLIAVASLIGIPPFIGFIGKVFIVKSLLSDTFNLHNLKNITALVIVLTTFISLVYYLKLPYYLFVKKYEDSNSLAISKIQIIFSAILVLPLIIGFFSFDWLLRWLQYVK